MNQTSKNIKQALRYIIAFLLVLVLNQLFDLPILQSVVLAVCLSTLLLVLDHYMPSYVINETKS